MAYNPEEDIKVSDLPEKTTDVVSDDKLLVIDSEDANILKQVDASKVWWWWSGTWDMLKSVYDKNNNGIVDNSEALWWKPASDYALSDDTQDKLESWVNIKTINWNSILWPWNIVIQGWWTVTVDDTLSTTSENPVQNKVINTALQNKQDTLVSGTNIKTVNNQSLLGDGDITIQGGWKMPVDINSTWISNLKYIYPKTIDWVTTLPRAFRVDYVVHEYYPLTNPTWTKDHQWTWYINFTLDDMNVSTNPSDWEFWCFFDWVYHNDCLIFIWYDQNWAYSWSKKRVPSSINSSWICVNNIVEDWQISSSYWADVRVIRTAIF